MFYLADQNHRPLYVGVAWTLCLEVRFYLSFIGLLVFSWLAGSLIVPAARKWTLIAIFVPLTAYSIYWRYATGELTFIGTWYMFAMGATLAWTITKRIRERWLWVVVAAAVGGELWQPDFRGTVAILAVLAIYAAAKTGKMGTWLSWSPIQNLGKISYSLYLCHVPVGLAVMSILQANGDDSHFLALASFTLASVVSIIVAQTLQKCVEGPCIKLAKRLKLKDPPGKKAIVAVPAPVSGPSMGLNLATG
jgi:peptidoglycan/LPS O-acetylase OafA/YrhL